LRVLSGREVCRILAAHGFEEVRRLGEPDEGKLHVRFDEGRLGRLRLNQSPTLQ